MAAPKIRPRPGGRGCAKNPADRKFTVSSRFAFHLNDNSEFLKGRGLLVVTYKMHYVGTTFNMKMNSNDKILCENIVNKQRISTK